MDAFTYIEERLKAGIWNARVLLRELRATRLRRRIHDLKDWLHPQPALAQTVAVRRFETPPGRHAQVDWGHFGTIEIDGQEYRLNGFTFTLGSSRTMMAEAALDQKLGTLLKMHEEAFRQLGGVPEEILYNRMKTVWVVFDDRGEVVWIPVFLRLCTRLGIHATVVAAVSRVSQPADPRLLASRTTRLIDMVDALERLGQKARSRRGSCPMLNRS